MTHQIETPERDIFTFLVKAWSEDLKSQFKWARAEGAYCIISQKTVFIPFYQHATFNFLPELQGFNRWRYWRFDVFHESMHLLYTPSTGYKDLIKNRQDAIPIMAAEIYQTLADQLWRFIEDCRIETLGLKTYVGYIPEQQFQNAVTYPPFKKAVKARGRLGDNDKCYLELNSGIIYSTSLGIVPIQHAKDIQNFIEQAHKVLTVEDAITLSIEITNWFIRNFSSEMPTSNKSESNSRIRLLSTVGTIGSGASDSGLKLETGPDALAQALKDLGTPTDQKESALEGSDSLKQEYARLLEAQDKEAKQPDPATLLLHSLNGTGASKPDWQRSVAHIPQIQDQLWSDLIAPIQSTISQMKNKLRRWKAQWRENLDVAGDDLDIEELIIGRLSNESWTNKSKIFYDEEFTSTKGKIAILVDASSSIGSLMQRYNQAAAIIAEGLNYVQAHFEVYYFNRAQSTSYTYIIKTLHEPWSIEQKERLANMNRCGGTPLHNTLDLLYNRLRTSGINRLIILTDGDPSSVEDCTKSISKLTSIGIRVAFIGISKASKQKMLDMLGHKALHRMKYCDTVEDIPEAFFSILSTMQ